MFFYLFLLFTVVPLCELALLVWLGGQTEWWVPIVIILADAVLGALLLRWQGWRAVTRIQDDMAAGKMPGDALVDGLLVFLAGALLITPGVLTDVVGFALLIPPLRALVKRGVVAWLKRHGQVQATRFTARYDNGSRPQSNSNTIIDARVIQSHVEDAG